MSPRHGAPLGLAVVAASLPGCPSRAEMEAQVVNASGILLLFYLVLGLATVGTHVMHAKEWFQWYRLKARKPAIWIGLLLASMGMVRAMYYMFVPGLLHIHAYQAMVLTGLGVSMFMWGRERDRSRQVMFAKLMSISVTFILAFWYVLHEGARLFPMMKR